MEIERIWLALILVAGFIWIRGRIRALPEERRPRALYGSFFLLAVGLIAGRWGVERLPVEGWAGLLIEAAGLVVLFVVTAALFTPFRFRGRGSAGPEASSTED